MGSKTEDPSSSSVGRVRFDPVIRIESIPPVLKREDVWWQRDELNRRKLALYAIIQDYQRQIDGRPLWLLSKQQRLSCENVQDVVRGTIRLLSSRKHNNVKDNQTMSLQLGASLDRAASVRGIEYGLIPKRKVLERQHVKKVCHAQKWDTPIKLAGKAATSSERCVLLAQIVARHDAAQAKIGWDDEPMTR
eukprot:scaffold43197_cov183-Amphora_coffeaeformis.AAC.2